MVDEQVKIKSLTEVLTELHKSLNGIELNVWENYYDTLYAVATKLFYFRQTKGVTRKEIAKNLKIPVRVYRKIEEGDCNITLELLCRICAYLNCQIEIRSNKK